MARQISYILAKCDYCGKEFTFKGGLSHFLRWDHHSCSYKCANKLKAQRNGNNGSNGVKDKLEQVSVPRKCLEFTASCFECPLDDCRES